ncbi:hypothetical protein [Parabacteroides sp. AM08-6]|uniref:hypothetical protein n=1 Tax=Parabacteroides sp. AM08-6 TaxID=2292053 RepID=UPI000F003630|nr:hypothetical protein [Parabacteroides sp. AM08-6]RHJ87839.1 hypothetical protein DW103_01330 [Parabacteroides sp. AM08-6]
MKRHWILILLVVLPFCLTAQQKTEYNRKGDEAMKRLDYSDARMWYEEGVVNCDFYSINQLTTIWLANQRMRPSMRSLMNKCLNCLNVMANENDTIAINRLVVYYTEGIGVPKSEELASYWQERLDVLRKPVEYTKPSDMEKQNKPKVPMKFFIGYAYSIEAPYGITIGGVKNNLGWFARFRTNMSFSDDYVGECRGEGEVVGTLPGEPIFNFTNKKKTNSYAATAGLVVKCAPWLYTSIGLGYGNRELLCEYETIDASDYRKHASYWCKNIDYSYKGVAADLDVMIKMGPVFVSAGCNTINFKYVDLNAGLGVFF